MKILDAGFNMDSIKINNSIITGVGDVLSTENDVDVYYDRFSFTYEIDNDFVIVNDLDEDVFGDYLEEIDIIVKENIKTNIL